MVFRNSEICSANLFGTLCYIEECQLEAQLLQPSVFMGSECW